MVFHFDPHPNKKDVKPQQGKFLSHGLDQTKYGDVSDVHEPWEIFSHQEGYEIIKDDPPERLTLVRWQS